MDRDLEMAIFEFAPGTLLEPERRGRLIHVGEPITNWFSDEPPARVAINATIAIAFADEFTPTPQTARVRRAFRERAMKPRERRFDGRNVRRW